jgi:hypothetical protein
MPEDIHAFCCVLEGNGATLIESCAPKREFVGASVNILISRCFQIAAGVVNPIDRSYNGFIYFSYEGATLRYNPRTRKESPCCLLQPRWRAHTAP